MGSLNHIPSLAIEPQQQPDPLSQYGKLQSIQALSAQRQQQQALDPGQLELQRQAIEAAKQENAQRTLVANQTKAMNDAFQGALTPDASTGVPTFDRNKILTSISASGNGSLVPKMTETFNQIDKNATELAEAKDKHAAATQDYFGALASEVKANGYSPAALGVALAHATANGYGPQAQQIQQQYAQDPNSIKKWVDQAIAGSPKQREVSAQEMSAQARKDQADKEARPPQPTEAALAVAAANGDPKAEAALKRLDQSRREGRPVINNMGATDAKDIADAIENGDQPPTLQGLYRNAGPVRAELARRGVPIAKMETDWKATQKYISTLNGPQQTRLRQAISSASDMADKVDSLYQEYHTLVGDAGMKAFNKVGLAAAKNLPGRAGAVATALDAQISDLTADLGNVYMGGNSPTDHALGLAGKNLSSDWNKQTFEEGLKQIHANIKIRQNSITHGAPAGLSGETNYLTPDAPSTAAPPTSGGYIPPGAVKLK